MQYLGGKRYIAKKLAPIINEVRAGRYLWEPFCGGLGLTPALGGFGCASDNCGALIALYNAVRAGWQPPRVLSRHEYECAKTLSDTEPLKAFAGFGVSFGGKYFGGYAADRKKQRYAECASNQLLKDIPACAGFSFEHCDFLTVEPGAIDALIYCDPPYVNTTGYEGKFDHERFYRRAVQWAAFTDVLISEYVSPIGICIAEIPRNLGMQSATKKAGRVERLFFIPKGSV
ncbi:MAG: putative phage protein [Verrucomicrobiales bacterium]|nr:putative phage protein [Verrucomicrobiales bacterium]